jgi:peroxiredoxin family protein
MSKTDAADRSGQDRETIDPRTMTIIVTKGTLDWAYPPFVLSSTAAAMGLQVTMFFTFYGLPLLLRELDLSLSPLGNPAMKMPAMGTKLEVPNAVSALPGFEALASKMMKNLMRRKGVAGVEELRAAALEGGTRMIACQMTLDLFEYSVDDMVEGVEVGGAATWVDAATRSHINLFI